MLPFKLLADARVAIIVKIICGGCYQSLGPLPLAISFIKPISVGFSEIIQQELYY